MNIEHILCLEIYVIEFAIRLFSNFVSEQQIIENPKLIR